MKAAVGVIGGDLRQRYLAQFLIKAGFAPVYGGDLCPVDHEERWNIPCLEWKDLRKQVSIIAAPIPMARSQGKITGTKLHWSELAADLQPSQCIFGGVFPEEMTRYLRRRGIRYWDYMKSDQIALQNAVATAEGAIAEAIKHWPENLLHCPCLVLGYGKCGRHLALRLKQFGAEVTVYARRKEVRVQAQTEGMTTADDKNLQKALSHCPVIFNTVPSPLFDQTALLKDHLLLELAGNCGCISKELAEASNIPYINCPGLPGKYAPKQSARILADYIIDMLENQEP